MTQVEKPFIYICSLMRTGSTVLSESLTELPISFIFREPHLGKNYFALKPGDSERLKPYDIDLEAFTKYRLKIAFCLRRLRWLGYRQDFMVRSFKNEIAEPLIEQGFQVGVKEINNWGWQSYVRHFPNMKVIITGRDPRDIFLSTYYLHMKHPLKNYTTIEPEIIASDLNGLFQYQLEMYENTDNLLVRYEDLCTDKQVIQKIKLFVQSSLLDQPAKVGQFVGEHPLRQFEHQVHGNSITTKSIGRWQQEESMELRNAADKLFDLMPTYTEFWGYKNN